MDTVELTLRDTGPGVKRVSDWLPSRRPAPADPETPLPEGAVRWFHVEADVENAEQIATSLAACCPGLDGVMLRDLLEPDLEPSGKPYGDGEIRLASSCSIDVVAEEDNRRRGQAGDVGGELVIQPIELLAGDGWLLSCCHPGRRFRGAEEVGERAPVSHEELKDAVASRWAKGNGASAGDLGTLVLYELVLSYGDAHRAIDGWHEDWELAYHQDERMDEASLLLHRARLTELSGAMAVLRDWIKPQNRTGLKENIDRAWLSVTDPEIAEKVDDRIDRALKSLGELSATLRASFGLLHVQQLELQRERREQLMKRIEIGAAAFLIPTLVVGFYGANTWVPGQGEHWGFWVMITALALLSIVGVCAVLLWQRPPRQSSD